MRLNLYILQNDNLFDLLSIHPDGGKERAIEVKGRAGIGDVEVTEPIFRTPPLLNFLILLPLLKKKRKVAKN